MERCWLLPRLRCRLLLDDLDARMEQLETQVRPHARHPLERHLRLGDLDDGFKQRRAHGRHTDFHQTLRAIIEKARAAVVAAPEGARRGGVERLERLVGLVLADKLDEGCPAVEGIKRQHVGEANRQR